MAQLVRRMDAQATLCAALNRSLNRAADSTRRLAVSIVRTELNVSASKLRVANLVTVTRARGDANKATVRVKGKSIPLSDFSGTRQTRRGLSVKVFKRGPRKVLKGRFLYPGAGGDISAERVTVGGKRVPRGPVKILFGPGAAQFLTKPHILARLQAHAGERFRVELERDLAFRLNRAGPS